MTNTGTKSLKFDPLEDGISNIELLEYMGGDLTVVNTARVSYNKFKKGFTDKDKDLIRYLVVHKHTSPLRSTVMNLRVKAPLFVTRQWEQHIIGCTNLHEQFTHNEQSYRYVKSETEFYIPKELRKQATKNKQSSAGVINDNTEVIYYLGARTEDCMSAYTALIDKGVCREQARLILPANTYTTWINTISLQAALHLYDLRSKENAQWEIRQYAKHLQQIIWHVAPTVAEAWERTH